MQAMKPLITHTGIGLIRRYVESSETPLMFRVAALTPRPRMDLGGARNTALRGLIQELPPTLVANALACSYQVIHKHAADAGVPMAGYAGISRLPRCTLLIRPPSPPSGEP